MGDESEREPIDVLEVFEASCDFPVFLAAPARVELGRAAGPLHLWKRALLDAESCVALLRPEAYSLRTKCLQLLRKHIKHPCRH